MVKDFVGNELHVGDIVLDLVDRKVCTVVKLYEKSITSSIQKQRQIDTWSRYGKTVTDDNLKYHKPGTCYVKIILPEGAE